MLKLENWSDLFKFNKELFEDDFNPGQALVVKSKQKSVDGVTVRYTPFRQMLIFLLFRNSRLHSSMVFPTRRIMARLYWN